MTHCMMNVGLMTSNDDIESSSSSTTTTTRKKTIGTRRKIFYTAGILNEKLTCFLERFLNEWAIIIDFVFLFLLSRFEIESCQRFTSLYHLV